MNKVQKKIYDSVMAPSLGRLAGNIVGIVKDFDNIMQTGTIEMQNTASDEDDYMYHVPLLNLGGVKQPNPFPGDTVLISFLASDYQHPVILGKIDSKHFLFTRNAKESHFRSGSNVSDLYSMREGEDWDDTRPL